MIEPGLLRAEVADVVAGELGELDERGEKSNGRDVRTGLGQREKFNVIAQEGCIVALAEGISFTNGFIGERNIKGRSGQSHTSNDEGNRRRRERRGTLGTILRTSIALNSYHYRSQDFFCVEWHREERSGQRRWSRSKSTETGVALRGIHVDDGGAGGKVFGGEIELESGAGESAAAFIAEKNRLAGRRERLELLVFAGNLNIEIFPEVIRARSETLGRAGAGTSGAHDVCAIRIGELDLHDDS